MRTTPPTLPLSHDLSRRRWLQAAGSLAAAACLPRARAQAASGYKALVCVFLYGGNDGMNCIVPTDSRYAQYQGVRKGLALASGQLKALDGVPFGLHPALAALQSRWNAGQMTAVFNTGPLVRRFASKDEFISLSAANSPLVPPNLFSHSDQQRLWQAADGEAFSRTGWGGRAAALVSPARTVFTLGGNALFGSSATTPALALPGPGNAFQISGIQGLKPDEWKYNVARSAAFKKLYADKGYDAELTELFVKQQNSSLAISDALSPSIKATPADLAAGDPIKAAFAPITKADGKLTTSAIGDHLFQVAKLIRQGQQGGSGPQIYFVQAGGYDTHGDQLNRQSALLGELSSSLSAFHNAMDGLGLGAAVTSFTESDFGRTFAPNNSGGTDHAWGNTQFVLGGAVKGKATYGTYPELTLGGPDDVGQSTWEQHGRWIPSTSVEQYAATLLSWLGVSDAQLLQVLPNLSRHTVRNLGFLA